MATKFKKKGGPGKSHRKGIGIRRLLKMFPDDETAERWFTMIRWPHGPACPHCGSINVQSGASHPTMPYRCRERECRKRFSLRTGSVMESSKLGYQTWAIAVHLVGVSLKSVSSMRLHRDLEITQKSAWHLAHRLREVYRQGHTLFEGPIEVDETLIGGKRRNKSNKERRALYRMGAGPAHGKNIVVGMKDRKTNMVVTEMIDAADKPTLQGFVEDHTSRCAKVYTDEAAAYRGMDRRHSSVNHSVKEYVRGKVHTNGIESHWSLLERAYVGTFHKLSPKHLQRYLNEFCGRHNMRDEDTITIMELMVRGMEGKRLRYKDLIAPNGLNSTARPVSM